MVVVAVVGTSSGLGLTFVQTLARNSAALAKHHFILLSRSPQPQWEAKGLEVRQVDWSSDDSITTALKDVHTVLNFLGLGAGIEPHLKLIEAAKTAGVTRFAPSEFAIDGPYDLIDLYKPKQVIWDAAKAAGFEVVQFQVGVFMSILATGTPKPLTAEGKEDGFDNGEAEALAGLRPWNFVINMKAGTADLARDGSAKIVLTDTRDIARFVIASIDLPHWPEKLGMQGCVTSFKEVIAYVEKVQKRKFLMKENTIAELEDLIKEDPDSAFYNQCRIVMDQGYAHVEPDLNKTFPDIKPVTMEEFVEKWWSGVELPEAAWEEDRSFTGSE